MCSRVSPPPSGPASPAGPARHSSPGVNGYVPVGLLCLCSLYSRTEAADELLTIDLTFDQTGLRAFLHRLGCHVDIAGAGENDNRNRGDMIANPIERVQPVAVRKHQVSDHYIEVAVIHPVQTIGQAPCHFNLEVSLGGPAQLACDQSGVNCTVFNHQHTD